MITWVEFFFVGGILTLFKFALVGEVLGACTECSVVGNLLESVANLCVFSEGKVWAERELVVWILVEPDVVFVLASSYGVCVEEMNISSCGGTYRCRVQSLCISLGFCFLVLVRIFVPVLTFL